MTGLDAARIREDFPILLQEHSPNIPLTFLDSTASSQKPRQVIEVLDDYYRRYNANVHRGIYKLSEEATSAYEESRKKIRKFINAKTKREIIFTRGTTESINLVANTWGRANLKAGDVVLSSVMEHHANIVTWQILEQQLGFKLKFIPITTDGYLDMDELARLIREENVRLVAVAHMSNVVGTINPVEEIITMAHEAGALVLLDGAQSTPHMPIDVQSLDVDFFAFSGHKMLGPTGIGVLYGKYDLLQEMPPWMGGGDMIATVTLEGSTWNELPYKFEAGTPAIAQAIGLGAAVDYLNEIGMANIHQHEQHITAYLLDRLSEVPGLTVFGPQDATKKGAVASFTFEGIHSHDLAQLLDMQGVAVRAGHHCAQPIHDFFGITSSTRASFYLYNSIDEVDTLIEALYTAKKKFTI